RQKRVGQYAWVLMIAFVASFIWLYNYTIKKTVAASQIASLQSMAMEDAKDRIQTPAANTLDAAAKESVSRQKVTTYDLEQAGTMQSIGETALPLGLALKVSSDPTVKKD